MKKVNVTLVAMGALGCRSQRFDRQMAKVGIKVRLQVIQKTGLIGAEWILRIT